MMLIKFFNAIFLVSLIILFLLGCSKEPVNNSALPARQEAPNPSLATSDSKCGLLLVLAHPINSESKLHGPSPKRQLYKTIFITRTGIIADYIQKDNLALAPGEDGFYVIQYIKGERIEPRIEMEINKIVTYKLGSDHANQVYFDANHYIYYSSEGAQIDFIGNKFLAICQLQAYTSGAGGWQYRLKNSFCTLGSSLPAEMENKTSADGLTDWKDIIPKEYHDAIASQIEAYKKENNITVHVESDQDRQYISETDLTLHRKEGAWRLVVPVKFSNWKSSHNKFIDFKVLECPLPASLISYDSLCIPWKNIKEQIPDAKDAVSSPDNSLLVVQTSNKLKVYILPLNDINKPVLEVDINENDYIILNQWCENDYVEEWKKELAKTQK